MTHERRGRGGAEDAEDLRWELCLFYGWNLGKRFDFYDNALIDE